MRIHLISVPVYLEFHLCKQCIESRCHLSWQKLSIFTSHYQLRSVNIYLKAANIQQFNHMPKNCPIKWDICSIVINLKFPGWVFPISPLGKELSVFTHCLLGFWLLQVLHLISRSLFWIQSRTSQDFAITLGTLRFWLTFLIIIFKADYSKQAILLIHFFDFLFSWFDNSTWITNFLLDVLVGSITLYMYFTHCL